jgi:hypothetical protein
VLVGTLASSSRRSVQSTAKVDSPHETEDPKNKVQSSGNDEPDEVQDVTNEVVGILSSCYSASKVYNSYDEGSNSESELNGEEDHEDNHDHIIASLNVEERLGSKKQS